MKKILAITALSLLITGCNSKPDIESTIEKTFTFAHPEQVLKFSRMSEDFYLVKSDNELYLYNSKSNIVVPAPRAVMVKQNISIEDAVTKGEIKFKTIFERSALSDTRNLAVAKSISEADAPPKLLNQNVSEQKSKDGERKPEITVEKKTLPSPDPVTVTPQSDLSPQKPMTVNSPAHDPVGDAKKQGESRLAALKEELKKTLLNAAARQSGSTPSPQEVPAPNNPAPLAINAGSQVESQVPNSTGKTLTSGIQYAYFNGNPILKVAYNENGRLLSPEEKKLRIIEKAKAIPMNWTINYPAIGKEKLQLFVFTDYTCPFCHKLHNDIQVLNQAGITVRYLYYPRAYSAGPRTPAAILTMEQMRRSWCAPNQGEAMTELFETRQLDDYKCDQVPEAKGRPEFPGPYQHFFGELFDLTATPLYFTDDGQMNHGYSTFEDFKTSKIKIPE
jgi:protein-disulfide isomerase